MKFNIDDKVKVVKLSIPSEITDADPDLYINETGVVTEIDSDYKYPYTVKFDNNIIDELGNELWGESELDYATEKKDIPLSAKLKVFIEKLKYENHQTNDEIIGGLEGLLNESNSK